MKAHRRNSCGKEQWQGEWILHPIISLGVNSSGYWTGYGRERNPKRKLREAATAVESVAYNCLLRGTVCFWNSSAMGLGHLFNQKFLYKAGFGVQSPPGTLSTFWENLCDLSLVDLWGLLITYLLLKTLFPLAKLWWVQFMQKESWRSSS